MRVEIKSKGSVGNQREERVEAKKKKGELDDVLIVRLKEEEW